MAKNVLYMEIAIVALLVIILVFLVILMLRKSNKPTEQELFSVGFLKDENQKLQQELTHLRADYINENNRATRAEENLKAQREISIKHQQNLEELQQKFTLEFSNIANKILDEKSAKFTAQNQTNLDQILNPLKANIKSFEEKVDKVYQTEAAERSQLKGVIFQLMDQSKQIQTDANNLTRALKGDSKKQGNWGEII